ncbi:hypothetical protein GCM10020008_10850 [Lentilactobacillus kefiri DSM 20587 = JCM 5818]|uniref:Uncharacterized protein n=1 Tax=Lentilactobacillus kefiri TaxID=33962 RepID=A0A511E1A7_LENKE|nr:hypothetical protein LKE01_20280 [Lentilactobacillus kefiri]
MIWATVTDSLNRINANTTEDGNSKDEIIGPIPNDRWGMKNEKQVRGSSMAKNAVMPPH